MTFLFLVPAALSALLLGAHFLRYQQYGLLIFSLILIPLLFVRRPWSGRVVQIALAVGAAVWLHTTLAILQMRQEHGEPFLRMVLILGGVAVVAVCSALLIQTRRLHRYFRIIPSDQHAAVGIKRVGESSY